MASTPQQIARRKALLGLSMSQGRALGMKREGRPMPTAAIGQMPFPEHRACAEWIECTNGRFIEREPTTAEIKRAARKGSAKLRDAILKAAAP